MKKLHKVSTRLLTAWIYFTGKTVLLKWANDTRLEDLKREYPAFILCTWHQNIYLSIWLLQKQNLNALVSQSKDGELIAQVMKHFGFNFIRGSSTRGGIKALKQMIASLQDDKSLTLTPDGPLGPEYKVQPGIILLAQRTGVPIIPWHYEAQHQWNLKSWDRQKIPKPFTSVTASFGKAFYVPAKLKSSEIHDYCAQLESVMTQHIESVQNSVPWKSSCVQT